MGDDDADIGMEVTGQFDTCVPPGATPRPACFRRVLHVAFCRIRVFDTCCSIVRRYEEYLDSQITRTDLFYLEDEELARDLVELGYRGSGEILKRDEFEAKKAAAEEVVHAAVPPPPLDRAPNSERVCLLPPRRAKQN